MTSTELPQARKVGARAKARREEPQSLYGCARLKDALLFSFHAARAADAELTWARLADVAGVSASYLSKVLSGAATLRPEILELLAPAFAWDDDALTFCEILAELERTTVPARAARLERRIDALRRVHLDLARMLDKEPRQERPQAPEKVEAEADAYHDDPLCALVHMALTIKAYRTDPGALARGLDVPLETVFEVLRDLERSGFVVREGGAWIPRRTNVHLPRSSPVFRRWSAAVRHACAARIARRAGPDDFLVSVTFSATRAERDAIRDALIGVLREAEARVDAAPEERLYQLNLDLFTWLEGD